MSQRALPRARSRRAGVVLASFALVACAACSAQQSVEIKGPAAAGPSARGGEAKPDGSHCEYKGRLDREVVESVGTGALTPSIRRVYRVMGEGEQRRRVLVCREVDTNLDGAKDLVRRYTDQGEAFEELADSDYDGNLDTLIKFSKGRISQVEVDQDHDGKPEETRYYVRGKLSRVQRDSNADGKADIWEIYSGGHLERMGVDVDFDGRVDRWNRDEVAARQSRDEAEDESGARKPPPSGAAPAEGDAGNPAGGDTSSATSAPAGAPAARARQTPQP